MFRWTLLALLIVQGTADRGMPRAPRLPRYDMAWSCEPGAAPAPGGMLLEVGKMGRMDNRAADGQLSLRCH
jgi:hypothetical protein